MIQIKKTTLYHFRYIACFLFLSSLWSGPTGSPAAAQEVFLCVWRNPERTMTRIFPDAHDYRTMTVNIAAEQLEKIESIIGTDVLPGQREQFQYYEMTRRGGEVIGYIIAVTQRGQYGAVEFVFGLDPDHSIRDLYIQRTRERDRFFRERDFLDRFQGVRIAGAAEVPSLYSGEATPGTDAVIKGIVKAMTSFDQLVLKQQ